MFVFIFNIFSNKPNPAALNNNKTIVNGNSNNSGGEPAVSLGGKACESCSGKLEEIYYAKINMNIFFSKF